MHKFTNKVHVGLRFSGDGGGGVLNRIINININHKQPVFPALFDLLFD